PAAGIRIDVVSIFPEMFDALTRHGITGRALQRGLWRFAAHNPREFTSDPYRRIDDRPYGGGPGMVMMCEPLAQAIAAARAFEPAGRPVIALSPQGRTLDDAKVRELAMLPGMILVAGRYEAIDQRLIDSRVDEEIS